MKQITQNEKEIKHKISIGNITIEEIELIYLALNSQCVELNESIEKEGKENSIYSISKLKQTQLLQSRFYRIEQRLKKQISKGVENDKTNLREM